MLKFIILYSLYKNKVARISFFYFVKFQYLYISKISTSKYSLIPRCDSELLIYIIIYYISKFFFKKFIDLGTGSGVISLSLYNMFSFLRILAIDIYISSLQVNSLYDKKHIYFVYSDWFNFLAIDKKYDIIISNPPYLSYSEFMFFYNITFEPKISLVTYRFSLYDIYKISILSYSYLSNNGIVLLEHGYLQSKIIRQALLQTGFINVFSCKDINYLFRISCGER